MKKYFAFISAIILFLCLFFLYSLKPEKANEQQMKNKRQIVFWVYSPSWLEIAEQFEREHPNVRVVVKLLKNSPILLEELYAAQSAGSPPDIAEMPSWYGAYPLIESNALLPVEDFLTEEYREEMPKAIAKRFQLYDTLWAIPISYEIPLLYVNEAYLSKVMHSADDLDSLDHLLQIGKELTDTTAIWGINADNMYPWYVMNLNEDTNEKSADYLEHDPEYLFHMNHMALTQFVNGEGGILLSSSGKMQLIEKLIGSKFKWSIAPFPIASEKVIPNGNGLVIFRKGERLSDDMEQFLSYVQTEEQLRNFAIHASMIPAHAKLINEPDFLDVYRHFPGYQAVLSKSLQMKGKLLQKEDGEHWNSIVEANENKE
ncbi:extracellular solute-binding protein [Bacillus sp. FJAT-50079]|uniref:ABC transporter substrate-binding protein n=1 Tax=Bacillus sp. FJAT-50079 TaxID=2833577 RepID=UPI001BCA3BE6|nr:extracellular solute-binding protein [Bacillus sp. FJAT-50079]MBS4209356.1 extracellular solute-binding protein [Bacillus sp. FJAT-50079]